MKKLIKYLKPYWYFAILSPLFMIGEVLIDLSQPTLMSRIVNEGVLQGNTPFVVRIGLTMLGLVALGGLFGTIAAYCSLNASQSFGNDLRKAAFSRVMSLSLEQTDTFTTGSLVTRLTNDITAVENVVSMMLRTFVRAPMNFIGGIVMALTISRKFSIVFLCLLPIELLIMILILRKASPLFNVVQTKLDKVNSVVQENITGARVVKAYVREEYEEKRFGEANLDLSLATLKVQKLLSLAMPAMMIIMNAAVVAIILVGGYQIEAGNMQVGSVMAAITYAMQILFSLMMVGMMFSSISRAKASAIRILEVLNTEPVIQSGNKPVPAQWEGLTFENVVFSYPRAQGTPVLSNISFAVKPGETVAILGATGSGKTSLINLILRFYNPQSGRILWNGRDIAEYDLEALRGQIACVLQKSELFAGKVSDNIRWGRETATLEEIQQAATIAQADDFISAMPDGYDATIAEKGTSLSGGQKQRVSIARAIIRQAPLLIFDDSTSALDLGTESRLQKALKAHLKDTAVILIAQRVASVQNADRILLLEQGEIVDSGTHDELIQRSALYQEICASQQFQKEVRQ